MLSEQIDGVLPVYSSLIGNQRMLATRAFVTDPSRYFLCRWTLKLVLQGEWPGLQRIVKTRISTSLHRCSQDAVLSPLINPLLPLVSSPWEAPQLKLVLDSDKVTPEEGKYASN